MMKQKLLEVLPSHEPYLKASSGKVLYIVDWKDENNGGISFDSHDRGRASVRLFNETEVSVCCDCFPENALRIAKGRFSKQCECVVFPNEDDEEVKDDTEWELFIEMKYAKDIFKAQDPRNHYPETMVQQIIKTVEYFRERKILPERKIVSAIVSFPILEHFNSWFNQSLLNSALIEHRIIMRATNSAKILDKQHIVLTQ